MSAHRHLTFLASALLLPLSAAAQSAPDEGAHGDPYVPVGKLQVSPTWVATGVKTTLQWEIEHPKNFGDLALAGASGALMTAEQVQAEIRVLGVAFQDDEGRDDLPATLWVRVGGGGSPWNRVFYGKAQDVNPSKVLFKEWVDPNQKIDLAAYGQADDGSWNGIVWTVQNSHNLAHLTNGDHLPDHFPDPSSAGMESFTSALLAEDEQTIEIGPKDMAYFFELDSYTPGEPGFDLQDMVVLVQCKTKNNNGHGNNEDGVDVSNPGQGSGGPNGMVDESGEIDDEMTKGKPKKG
jgi:hypothetical protein